MTKRSLFSLYILLLFSSGLYGLLWLHKLIEQLKIEHSYKATFIINNKIIIVFLALFLASITFGVFLGTDPKRIGVGADILAAIAFISGVAVMFCLLFNLILVNSFLRDSLGLKTLNNLFAVLLFVFFFLSPIKIQDAINNYYEWSKEGT